MSLLKVVGEAEPKYVGYPVFGANRPRMKQLTFGRTKESCRLFVDDVATHKHTLHEAFCQLNNTRDKNVHELLDEEVRIQALQFLYKGKIRELWVHLIEEITSMRPYQATDSFLQRASRYLAFGDADIYADHWRKADPTDRKVLYSQSKYKAGPPHIL